MFSSLVATMKILISMQLESASYLCGEMCKCEALEECVNCYKHAPQYYYQQSYAPYQYQGQPYYYPPQQHQQYVY